MAGHFRADCGDDKGTAGIEKNRMGLARHTLYIVLDMIGGDEKGEAGERLLISPG